MLNIQRFDKHLISTTHYFKLARMPYSKVPLVVTELKWEKGEIFVSNECVITYSKCTKV